MLPLKWMALESIQDQVFTTKSDVWSFGVVVWEVFSYGRAPFGNLTAVEVGRALESGSRLERPVDCPAPVFSIAESCWALSPDARPSFRELGQRLREEPSSAHPPIQRISGVCIVSWVGFRVTCPSLRGIAMTSWMRATCRLSPNEPSRKFRGRVASVAICVIELACGAGSLSF